MHLYLADTNVKCFDNAHRLSHLPALTEVRVSETPKTWAIYRE